MSTAESHSSDPEVIVAQDGSVPGISAAVAARFGFRPGMHLRLVSDEGSSEMTVPSRKSAMGILKGKIDVDAIEEAMAWNKEQRVASVMDGEDDK